MIDVIAPAGAYRAAATELPLSTHLGESAVGAIVIVPGGPGWVDGALAAASAGAAAVVIGDPDFVPSAELRRLTAAAPVPLIVSRPLLRADVAEDAVAARTAGSGWTEPRLLVADTTGPRGRLPLLARDAAGWLRVLAGARLSVSGGEGGLLLLTSPTGLTATLTVTATARPGAGRISARALGELTTEIEVEGQRGRVVAVGVEGRSISPRRFESPERLALRRAVAAAAGSPCDDIADLLVDTEIVERGLRTMA